MLRDRKLLLEQEIAKTSAKAANMYLSIVIGGSDIHSEEYQQLRNHIANLQFDLKMVTDLIDQGQK